MELDLDFKTVASSLTQFEGVQRRFEIVTQSDELILIDDYGHHPVEVKATLRTAKETWPDRRLIVVFQPHRYSRTKLLMKDFWSAFNDADHVLVMDIFLQQAKLLSTTCTHVTSFEGHTNADTKMLNILKAEMS